MLQDNNLKLKAFTAFFSAYADLKDQGDISEEDLTQVSQLLDQLEATAYEDMIDELMRIFPDYQPKEIGMFMLEE
ncbi:MAG: hypothetical protein ACQEQG_03285 [Bacillota bacterium]